MWIISTMDGTDQPDIPRDDASIEILSEGGDSHTRDLEWSIYSAGRSSIAGSDVGSMDFQKLSIHSKMATIVHHDGRQFIERRDLDDGGLPYSAEFYLGDELWKLNGEDCFLMSPRRYIAKVSLEGTVDVEGAVDFEGAVRMLLKQLKVVKVLLDEQLEECNKAMGVLKVILENMADKLWGNIDIKRDVILLRILLQKHGNSLKMNFKHDLRNCSRLSNETMLAFDNYVTTTLKMIQRNEILGHLNDSSLSDEFINHAIQEVLNVHRARLATICPNFIQDNLKQLSDDRILYVSTNDMKLFSDLTAFIKPPFDSALSTIFTKFLTRAQETNEEQLVDLEPLSNRIFLYVCKSLLEVADQLETDTKNNGVIIFNETSGWEATELQEESQAPYSKCLRQQLRMLAALANHFEPGGPFHTSSNCSRHFPYEFKLFQNMDAIPEPVRIWLCLLDDCMKDRVQADSTNKMEMLSCFFRSYVSSIASEDFDGETMDCLRTITHDALRSLVGMKSSDPKTSNVDLLEYNEMIVNCLDKFLCEHFEKDCSKIQTTLRRIIGQVVNSNVTSEESIEFSHAFKQLLKDISDLPLEWYLRLPPSENRNLLLRGQFVVSVDNRWKDTEHECLKVVDPEGFVKFYKFLHNGAEIPKHYQLKAVKVLLDMLTSKQSYYEGKVFSDKHQVGTMIHLMKSIRNALLYLNSQPDYSCFEDFLQKLSESFSNTIKEDIFANICDPMSSMHSSAETDPSHKETQDPLLNLFEDSISKEQLASCLKLYTTQFNKHIMETVQLSRESRIKRIISDVVLKVKPQLATTWTEEFKRNELPKILAGLSAVWSLVVSQNGCSLEKLMKPSNMQIGCVLSFFGDQNCIDDYLYRMLYISTQQGKELVLGLTASLLALYGHKVLIACYNSNLARRNSIHLIELFKCFSVQSRISFGSMEDIAREKSRKLYEKYSDNIHECLGIEKKENNCQKNASEDGSSVLLIDDMDLIIQNKILGQKFDRIISPTIPGIGLLQEKMHCRNNSLTTSEVHKFIESSDHPQIRKLKVFLGRPQSYTILEGYSYNEVKKYTNKTLFDMFLKISERFSLYSRDRYHTRLSKNGVMKVKKQNDRHETDYFTLKKSDFKENVNGYKNYGFLILGCLPFPYARMLKSFPLVLGFAGAPLDGYEEVVIHNHYNIYRKIAKSNTSPAIPVKFDSKRDFRFVTSENIWDWMVSIMVAVNAAIERNCTVLVFFKRDEEMDQFQSIFSSELKQLHVTVIETASNGENLSEDEVAIDEVTVLVIERNGDSVENREVHVIQTFFSDDGKEENLIRSQAVRSHGSGSYELILYRRDVSIPHEKRDENVTYDFLVKLRPPRSFGDAIKSLHASMKVYENVATFCN